MSCLSHKATHLAENVQDKRVPLDPRKPPPPFRGFFSRAFPPTHLCTGVKDRLGLKPDNSSRQGGLLSTGRTERHQSLASPLSRMPEPGALSSLHFMGGGSECHRKTILMRGSDCPSTRQENPFKKTPGAIHPHSTFIRSGNGSEKPLVSGSGQLEAHSHLWGDLPIGLPTLSWGWVRRLKEALPA